MAEIDESIFTQDEFLQWLYETNDQFVPDMPPFEFLQALVKPRNQKEVCITAFVDPFLAYHIDLESACKEYRSLPHEGSLLDQPQALLDIFAIIRQERNRYERVRADKLMAGLKGNKTMKDIDDKKDKKGRGKLGG
jgi:hypothetical protein